MGKVFSEFRKAFDKHRSKRLENEGKLKAAEIKYGRGQLQKVFETIRAN